MKILAFDKNNIYEMRKMVWKQTSHRIRSWVMWHLDRMGWMNGLTWGWVEVWNEVQDQIVDELQ